MPSPDDSTECTDKFLENTLPDSELCVRSGPNILEKVGLPQFASKVDIFVRTLNLFLTLNPIQRHIESPMARIAQRVPHNFAHLTSASA